MIRNISSVPIVVINKKLLLEVDYEDLHFYYKHLRFMIALCRFYFDSKQHFLKYGNEFVVRKRELMETCQVKFVTPA
jgi:hypothetical protein